MRKGKNSMMSEINVVPYIDVMLVLLIIFMVTAPLLTTGVQVDLPNAPADPIPDDEEPFVVTVDINGDYYFDNETEKPASEQEIRNMARIVLERNPDLPFMVRGDGGVAYSEVVKLMVLLQQAGVDSVGLVTDPPGT